MKYWTWIVLLVIFAFASFELLQMPLWLEVVLLMPVLAIGLSYGALRYNMRDSLRIEEVPKYGYAPRLKELDEEGQKIEGLDFQRFDRFYLKTVPDSVTDVYKHNSEPIKLSLIHFGQKQSYELTTRFQDGFFLTTSNNVDSGLIPLPRRSLIQIYHNQSYNTLFKQHKDAIKTFAQNRIEPYDLPEEEFRSHLMTTFRTQMKKATEWFMWPLVLIWRTMSKPGKIYCKSIADQYPDGLPRD